MNKTTTSPQKIIARLHINISLVVGGNVLLDENSGHYLVNVMRIKEGDVVALFNGRDGEWAAKIGRIGKGKAQAEILDMLRPQQPESDLWLLFAPIKKARLDYMVQKATELGASRIWPVITQRTNMERIKSERLLANAVEAAEQCERLTIPDVDEPQALFAALDNWPADRTLFFCDEEGDALTLAAAKTDQDRPEGAILIGPEGGFTPEEREKLRSLPFVVPITLGPRILRADTAAVAAMALYQSVRGDWQPV